MRDWGHAKDYVRMQWLMLQQEQADDFVIATGNQLSVRHFVRMAAEKLGIELAFKGEGLGEVGVVVSVDSNITPAIKVGDEIVKVDPRYFRPAEVENLLGDPSKAKNQLNWQPEISIEELCAEMVANDLEIAKRDALLKTHGYDVLGARE